MLQKEQASGIIIDKITLCMHDSHIAFRKIEKIILCMHDSHIASVHLILTKIAELAMISQEVQTYSILHSRMFIE